jgi:hypothetical protein
LCTLYKVEFTKIEREHILAATGGIALHLNEFLKLNYPLGMTNKLIVKQAISKYFDLANHCLFNCINFDTFIKKLEPNAIKTAIKNLFKLLSGEPIDFYTYDRRFLYQPKNNPKILKAISSLALNRLVYFYLYVFKDKSNAFNLEKWYMKSMYLKNLHSACKFQLTEKYIIMSLVKRGINKMSTSFNVHVLKNDANANNTDPLVLEMDYYHVIYFE